MYKDEGKRRRVSSSLLAEALHEGGQKRSGTQLSQRMRA